MLSGPYIFTYDILSDIIGHTHINPLLFPLCFNSLKASEESDVGTPYICGQTDGQTTRQSFYIDCACLVCREGRLLKVADAFGLYV